MQCVKVIHREQPGVFIAVRDPQALDIYESTAGCHKRVPTVGTCDSGNPHWAAYEHLDTQLLGEPADNARSIALPAGFSATW
jgi:hypothetical protein